MPDHVVVGGGHNGLVTACYLARAGLDVLVLEQSDKLGGGSRTEELIPGYRFNTHSAAHNIINATGIIEELGLPAAGLEYREMDPFSVAVHRDGAIVRFHRSVARTVESIRAVEPAPLRWVASRVPPAAPQRKQSWPGTAAAAVDSVAASQVDRRGLRPEPTWIAGCPTRLWQTCEDRWADSQVRHTAAVPRAPGRAGLS